MKKDLPTALKPHKSFILKFTSYEQAFRNAAMRGKFEIFCALLSFVDINSAGKETGTTALHAACQGNHVEIILWLLDLGASCDIPNHKNQLPLDLAASETRSAVIVKSNNLRFLSMELRDFVCSLLSSSDLLNLIIADPNRFLHFYPQLAKRPDYPLRRLFCHAALAEWNAAQVIWMQNPAFFLTCRGTVYHPNPKEITSEMSPNRPKYTQLTVWQIAWVNEEYHIVNKMAKFMTNKEQLKQFTAIFPDRKIIKHNWDLEDARALLHNLFDAVIQDKTIRLDDLNLMNAKTRVALNAVNNYINFGSEHKTGLVFDTMIYVEALGLYQEKHEQFQNEHQRSFWCIRVEESLAGRMGTKVLRRHARGIGKNEEQADGCLLEDHSSYFAFRRNLDSILGFHACVGNNGFICEGRAAARLPLHKNRWFEADRVYSIALQQQELAESYEREFAAL